METKDRLKDIQGLIQVHKNEKTSYRKALMCFGNTISTPSGDI